MWDWSWVERYQTLISGVLAICAALIAAIAIYHSAQAPLKAERRTRAEEAEARRRAHALALRVEVQVLVNNVALIQQISVYHHASHNQMRLDTPASLQDWHLAAAHPPPIPDEIENLILTLRAYQNYIDTDEDWKTHSVDGHFEVVDERARALVKAIDSEYSHSTPS